MVIVMVVLGGVMATYSNTQDNIISPTVDDENNESEDDTETSNTFDYPPGITERDEQEILINSEELMENHLQIMSENSVTVSNTENNVENVYSSDETNTHLEKTNGDNIEKYSTDEYTVINNNGNYYGEDGSITVNEYAHEDEISSFVKYLSVESYNETENGNLELHLTSNNFQVTNSYDYYRLNEIDSASVELTITEDGLIKNVEYELVGSVDDNEKVVNGEFIVSDVGNTDVTEPNWVSNAENTVSILDGVYDDFQGWMLIEHKHLTTIPQGEEIHITDLNTDETVTVELPTDVEEGDGIGLSLSDDGTWDVTVNEMPDEGDTANTFGYNIRAEHDNNQEYFNYTYTD